MLFGSLLILAIIVAVILLVIHSVNNPNPSPSPSDSTGVIGPGNVLTDPSAEPIDTPEPEPEIEVQSITISNITNGSFSLPGIGGSYRLEATIAPTEAVEDGARITWSSEDTAIASVNPQTGLVTANAKGTTRIIAESGSVQAVCTVYVDTADLASPGGSSSASSGPGELNVLKDKEGNGDVSISSSKKETFKLLLKPDIVGDSYYCNDINVATVDPDGTVTAVARGTCKVTLTKDGYSYNCTVRVK
jgi:hypothetical protein